MIDSQKAARIRGAGLVELIVGIAVLTVLVAGLSASMVAGHSLDRTTLERDLVRETARTRLESVLAWPDHSSTGPTFHDSTFEVEGWSGLLFLSLPF